MWLKIGSLWWLITWWHQAITLTNLDLMSSLRSCGIHLVDNYHRKCSWYQWLNLFEDHMQNPSHIFHGPLSSHDPRPYYLLKPLPTIHGFFSLLQFLVTLVPLSCKSQRVPMRWAWIQRYQGMLLSWSLAWLLSLQPIFRSSHCNLVEYQSLIISPASASSSNELQNFTTW